MISLRKRILKSMMVLTTLILLLTLFLTSFIAYTNFTSYIQNQNEITTNYYANTLKISNDNILNSDILLNEDKRITVINRDGDVIYDNKVELSKLKNHKDRPEVIGAFKTGTGKSKRFSSTLAKQTIYYAQLSNNYVIRTSVTTDTILTYFTDKYVLLFVLLFGVIVICNIFANKLSKRIVNQISDYEEISPYVTTINKQQKKMENQSLEMESNLKTLKVITDNMIEGLLVIDEENHIASMNKSIENIFKVNKENYIGKNIIELFRNYDFYSSVSGNDNDSLNVNIGNKYYNIVLNTVIFEEVFIGKVILFIDITKQEKVSKIRREFSANVSHELKTPLSSILGYSELIESGLADLEKQKEFISKIKIEAINMNELIDDIIFISNLDEKESIELKLENIEEIVKKIIERFSSNIEKLNLKININIQTTEFNVNYRLFYEIMYNLIDNAIKYNEINGEIKIEVTDQLKIAVSNTGEVISQIDIERIFERFYRIEKSRNKESGGSGLGLAIVKHSVLAHNGEIKVTSNNGYTTFEIII